MRGLNVCVVVVVMWAAAAPAPAQDAAASKPPARDLNRFDELDPEIRKAADMDFATVDLATIDLRTKVLGGIALQDLLTVARNKAEHRLDLIMGFIEEQNLGEAFGKAPPHERTDAPMTFTDGQKLAVAFVTTDTGGEDYAGKLPTTDDAMLKKMATAYDSMNRKMWNETIDLRRNVDRAARFLDGEGKFDAFLAWAQIEAKKDADAREQAMAQRQHDYAVRMEKERAERLARAEVAAQRNHEEKMKRLELSYQYKTEKLQAQAAVAVSYNQRNNYSGNWGWNDDYYRNRYDGRYRGRTVYRR